MNSYDIYPNPEEKPLDKLVEGYSHTSIFRRIAFIGDSLSSGEFETKDADGTHHYHDIFEYSWGQFIARNNGITVEDLKDYYDAEFEKAVMRSVLTGKVMAFIRENAIVTEV